eukprot:g469.t1
MGTGLLISEAQRKLGRLERRIGRLKHRTGRIRGAYYGIHVRVKKLGRRHMEALRLREKGLDYIDAILKRLEKRADKKRPSRVREARMMQLDLQRDAAEKALDAVATELDTLKQDSVQTLRGVDSIVNDAEDDEDLFDGIKGFQTPRQKGRDVGTSALPAKQRRVKRSHRQQGGESSKSDERIAGGAARASQPPRRAKERQLDVPKKHRKSNRTDGLSLNALENSIARARRSMANFVGKDVIRRVHEGASTIGAVGGPKSVEAWHAAYKRHKHTLSELQTAVESASNVISSLERKTLTSSDQRLYIQLTAMMEELDILREWIEIAWDVKRRGAPQIAARKTVGAREKKRARREEVSLLVADDPNMSPATFFRALCPTLMKAVRNLQRFHARSKGQYHRLRKQMPNRSLESGTWESDGGVIVPDVALATQILCRETIEFDDSWAALQCCLKAVLDNCEAIEHGVVADLLDYNTKLLAGESEKSSLCAIHIGLRLLLLLTAGGGKRCEVAAEEGIKAMCAVHYCCRSQRGLNGEMPKAMASMTDLFWLHALRILGHVFWPMIVRVAPDACEHITANLTATATSAVTATGARISLGDVLFELRKVTGSSSLDGISRMPIHAWEGCWSILLDIASVQYRMNRGDSKDDGGWPLLQSLLSAELNRDQASEMRVDALVRRVLLCSLSWKSCDANSAAAQDFKNSLLVLICNHMVKKVWNAHAPSKQPLRAGLLCGCKNHACKGGKGSHGHEPYDFHCSTVFPQLSTCTIPALCCSRFASVVVAGISGTIPSKEDLAPEMADSGSATLAKIIAAHAAQLNADQIRWLSNAIIETFPNTSFVINGAVHGSESTEMSHKCLRGIIEIYTMIALMNSSTGNVSYVARRCIEDSLVVIAKHGNLFRSKHLDVQPFTAPEYRHGDTADVGDAHDNEDETADGNNDNDEVIEDDEDDDEDWLAEVDLDAIARKHEARKECESDLLPHLASDDLAKLVPLKMFMHLQHDRNAESAAAITHNAICGISAMLAAADKLDWKILSKFGPFVVASHLAGRPADTIPAVTLSHIWLETLLDGWRDSREFGALHQQLCDRNGGIIDGGMFSCRGLWHSDVANQSDTSATSQWLLSYEDSVPAWLQALATAFSIRIKILESFLDHACRDVQENSGENRKWAVRQMISIGLRSAAHSAKHACDTSSRAPCMDALKDLHSERQYRELVLAFTFCCVKVLCKGAAPTDLLYYRAAEEGML